MKLWKLDLTNVTADSRPPGSGLPLVQEPLWPEVSSRSSRR